MEVLLWFLWLCSAPVLSLVTEKKLWYESRPRTWDEARQFCRSEYGGELATIETSSDWADLKAIALNSFHAWLGLKKQDSIWRWWNGYEENDIEDLFAEGEPQSGHECGKIIRWQTKIYTDDCEQRHFFFCESRHDTHLVDFVTETKSWAEARKHCEKQGRHLMDFHDSYTFSWTTAPIYTWKNFPVWIGLHRNGSAWRWSDGTPSQSWTSGPHDDDSQREDVNEEIKQIHSDSASCVSVTSIHNTMRDCSQAFPFVCERLSLVLVKERLSWDHGLEVCSNISAFDSQGDFSLLSVEESDLPFIMSHTKGATSKVWLGLRFLAGSWFWSDGAVVSLPSLPSCPEARLRCGALVLNTSSIEPADCSQELNVLCHKRRRQ